MKGHAKLLLLGMLAGLSLAIIDLTWQPQKSLTSDVVARVDDYTITQSEFAATVNGIEGESKTELTNKQRQALLDRMVEEYLLVQYAKSQDLLMVNPDLRRRAVDKVLQTLREQAFAMQPTDDELTEFITQNRAYFGLGAADTDVKGLLTNSPPTHRSEAKPDEQIISIATTEWQRRQAETLLEKLITQLREQADVKQVTNP